MKRHVRWSIVILAIVATGCVGTQVSTQIGTVTSGPSITAVNLAFDRSELAVTAGEATGLLFDNRDTAPHNVAVYTDEGASKPLFVGEIFSGPGSREYELPALAAGTYFFRCDIHHDMQGTLVAKP